MCVCVYLIYKLIAHCEVIFEEERISFCDKATPCAINYAATVSSNLNNHWRVLHKKEIASNNAKPCTSTFFNPSEDTCDATTTISFKRSYKRTVVDIASSQFYQKIKSDPISIQNSCDRYIG